jgi:putative ATPase
MLFTEEQSSDSAVSGSGQPLAARMRPASFDEYAGQRHILADGKLLRRAIETDRFTSVILYGPAGVGKTSLAELIASVTSAHFQRLSAVTGTVKDVRRCIEEARARRQIHDRRTILFVDEIHRFNKTQQDALLPDVESGTIRFIGATTENPFFSVIGPLISRSQVFELKSLSAEDVIPLLKRAVNDRLLRPGKSVVIDDEAAAFLASACEGDARRALTALEAAATAGADVDSTVTIDLVAAQDAMQSKAVVYGRDGHYDTVSAFIKSMRAGNPDAAVYWLAKMLEAGEDIVFIARRIVIFAAEDIGNADPRALTLATSAMQAVKMIGMPEARIILAQAVTYCATSPKSNASYAAINAAIADIQSGRVQDVPAHLKDGHYKGAASLGRGVGYEYPHDSASGVTSQACMVHQKRYYKPIDNGYEARIIERMNYWQSLRHQAQPEKPNE